MVTMPKVLFLDIETSPILGYVWGLWDNNVALNQIHTDWHVLSWSAKWEHDPPSKTMYMDQRHAVNVENDRKILAALWKLIDQADVVVTQNGKRFDAKKLNARFAIHGFIPPSSYRHIDTCQIARQRFGFTSNKLEYLSEKINKKYKKLKHSKFSGFELWRQCLNGNIKAWREMEKYNKYDVLALEELYKTLRTWDNTVSFDAFTTSGHLCKCGSRSFKKQGYAYTNTGKFQRYRCQSCGAELRDRTNLLGKKTRVGIK